MSNDDMEVLEMVRGINWREDVAEDECFEVFGELLRLGIIE